VPELVAPHRRRRDALPIHVAGPDVEIRADPDQLEQLLINLVHNASDPRCRPRRGQRRLKREGRASSCGFFFDDEGSGLTNASNLFVPFFFLHEPGRIGIGSSSAADRRSARRLAGRENRTDRRGCRPTAFARLRKTGRSQRSLKNVSLRSSRSPRFFLIVAVRVPSAGSRARS